MSDKEAGKRLIHSAYQARAIAAGLERYQSLPDEHEGDAVQEAIIAAIAAARPYILEEAARIADAYSAKLSRDSRNNTSVYALHLKYLDMSLGARNTAAAIRAAKEGEG